MQSVVGVCVMAVLAAGVAVDISPVTRVVNLLKELRKQTEKDQANEEDLYEGFVCWGKKVIATKTASNLAAESRVAALRIYLSDTEAGLENERKDALQGEIDQCDADILEAKTLRDKESAEYVAAKEEMDQAIAALTSAMAVLDTATKPAAAGASLLATKQALMQGTSALLAQQQSLKHAAMLGDRFLGKADATFLRRLLSGDVPKVDWNKVHGSKGKTARQATFKMAYKGRSFKIQAILKKMDATFKANLLEATNKENKALTDYNVLFGTAEDKMAALDASGAEQFLAEDGSKRQQRTEAQRAFTDDSVELTKLDAAQAKGKEEKRVLERNLIDDAEFIRQTGVDLSTKKTEFKARKALRASEIEAMSKAISILASDDARDLMKKSFASQEGLFLLQTSSTQKRSAVSAIRLAAKKSGDLRLFALAQLTTQTGAISDVVTAIGDMVGVLQQEDTNDLKKKEDCERDRLADTRTAALKARDMDDRTDAMAGYQAQVDEYTADIATLTADKQAASDELAAAQKLRNQENGEWIKSNADDTNAAAIVTQAKNALEKFYNDNSLALGLIQKRDEPLVPVVAVAAKAPEAPAATWDSADYGGNTEESTGVVALMEIVHADILKDKAKAKQEEDDAAAAFGGTGGFKEKSEQAIQALGNLIIDKEGFRGDDEKLKGDEKVERVTSGQGLEAAMSKMAGLSPTCEYFTENFEMRKANRAIEVDGLQKAKSILNGGSFGSTPTIQTAPQRLVGGLLQKKFLQRHW